MRVIQLPKGQATTVDDDDFAELAQYCWQVMCTKGKWYARRNVYLGFVNGKHKYTPVYLHRVIMKAERSQQVDHKNGNSLDNRRENLRFSTQSQNMGNKRLRSDSQSGFKGVEIRTQGNKTFFIAYIKDNGKKKHLGCFATAEEAHAAYCANATRVYGEFARFN